MDSKNFVPVDKVNLSFIINTIVYDYFTLLKQLAHFALFPQYMKTNITDVFCGGDLSIFPLKMAKDQKVNIGHWQIAQAHGNYVKQSPKCFN